MHRAVASEGRKRLAEQGLEPIADTPPEAARRVASEMQRWAGVIQAAGIKAD